VSNREKGLLEQGSTTQTLMLLIFGNKIGVEKSYGLVGPIGRNFPWAKQIFQNALQHSGQSQGYL